MGNPFKDIIELGPQVGVAVLLVASGAGIAGLASFEAVAKLTPNMQVGAVLCLAGVFLLVHRTYALRDNRQRTAADASADFETWQRLVSMLLDRQALYQTADLEHLERVHRSLHELRKEIADILKETGGQSSLTPVLQQIQEAIRDYDGAMSEMARHIRRAHSDDYKERYGDEYRDGSVQFPNGISGVEKIYPPIFQYAYLLALGALRGKIDFCLRSYATSKKLETDLQVFSTGSRIGRIFYSGE